MKALHVFWVFLKVVESHDMSLKQLISKNEKNKKINLKKGFKKRKPEGKISQVVSEALIGEEKNFGRFFFFFS